MLKLFVFLLLLLPLTANAASPQDEAIYKYIPNAKEVGAGTYSQALWDIYNATLFAPEGKYTGAAPYALSITYLVSIDGKDIADRSIDEMRKTGVTDEAKLAAWGEKMTAMFPNVENGSNLTAIVTKAGKTIFLSEGKVIGTIADKDFAPCFLGMWLNPNSPDMPLRDELTGSAK